MPLHLDTSSPTPNNTPEELKTALDKAIAAALKELYPPKLVVKPDVPFNTPAHYLPTHRKTSLDLDTLTRLMITMDGGSIAKELESAGIHVTKSAFVQRLDGDHFWLVFKAFNNFCEDTATFKGYHVFAVDGTAVNIARNPSAPSFMQNDSNLRGYNQLHATVIFDVLNKTYLDCYLQPQPQMDEIGALQVMFPWNSFPQKSIIVGDRGFESYNLFAHFIENQPMDFLIRIKQEITAMKIIRNLPMAELDEDVEGEITMTQTKEDAEKDRIFIQTHANPDRKYSSNTRAGRWDFSSPYSMKFRVVRFQLSTGMYETLATSLPRDLFTLDDIRELYHARWGIETAFRELKYGFGLVNLHGKSDGFVMQEIYAAFTMANFCSRVASQVVLENRQNAPMSTPWI